MKKMKTIPTELTEVDIDVIRSLVSLQAERVYEYMQPLEDFGYPIPEVLKEELRGLAALDMKMAELEENIEYEESPVH